MKVEVKKDLEIGGEKKKKGEILNVSPKTFALHEKNLKQVSKKNNE